jgi:hypothetical protein
VQTHASYHTTRTLTSWVERGGAETERVATSATLSVWRERKKTRRHGQTCGKGESAKQVTSGKFDGQDHPQRIATTCQTTTCRAKTFERVDFFFHYYGGKKGEMLTWNHPSPYRACHVRPRNQTIPPKSSGQSNRQPLFRMQQCKKRKPHRNTGGRRRENTTG